MRPGDIIIYSPNNKTKKILSFVVSFLSRFVSGSWINNGKSFNHIAIASDKLNCQFESTFFTVKETKIKFDSYDIMVLKKDITEKQREIIINHCKRNLGKIYDLLAILTIGLINIKNSYVCSELVYDAYKKAGVILSKRSQKLISPNEIYYKNEWVTEKIKPIYYNK